MDIQTRNKPLPSRIVINRNIIIAGDKDFNSPVCGDLALYFKNANELQYQLGMIETILRSTAR
jgi:hypothetical protein